MAATVSKVKKGKGLLQGKQVVFYLNSSSGNQGEEGNVGDWEALVRMAGGRIVKEGEANANGKDILVVVDEGGKEMEEVARLRRKEAKVVDKKTFLQGLIKQTF